MKSATPIFYLLLLAGIFQYSCSISLSGVQVPVEVNTFNVEYIPNNAQIIVPTLSQEVTDQLIEKVLRETRLKLDTDNPDLIFTGEIVDYDITSQAPTAGQNTSLNRLDIRVKIEFSNPEDDEAGWTQNFTNFQNFDPSENLADVQDDLIATILKDIVEDIYQKAFTNW